MVGAGPADATQKLTGVAVLFDKFLQGWTGWPFLRLFLPKARAGFQERQASLVFEESDLPPLKDLPEDDAP